MPSFVRKDKVACEHCGTQVTRNNFVRHKTRCSAGSLYCIQCPNFSTLSQDDLNYHVAKKRSAPRPSITYKCKLCHVEFPVIMLYVNTKTLNMEHRLDSERAILMWVVKIQSYLNHFWETVILIALLLREVRYNPTTTISVCLEH